MSFLNNRSDLSPLRDIGVKWSWFLALGIILVIIGFVASIYLVLATVAVAMCIGFMLIFAGIIEVVHAFGVKGWKQFLIWLIAGILYIMAGFTCFYNPLIAAVALTFVFAIFLIIAGIVRTIIGLQSRGISGSGWITYAGILSILVGLIILFGWPINSLWILGLFLAIDLIFQGWGWVMFAMGLKSLQS